MYCENTKTGKFDVFCWGVLDGVERFLIRDISQLPLRRVNLFESVEDFRGVDSTLEAKQLTSRVGPLETVYKRVPNSEISDSIVEIDFLSLEKERDGIFGLTEKIGNLLCYRHGLIVRV